MYRDTVVCTVGTSLLNNLKKESDGVSGEAWREISKKNYRAAAKTLLKLDPDDKVLGAEINSMFSLARKGYLDSLQKLYLLVSDTEEGRAIGNLLREYFTLEDHLLSFKSVELVVIEKLDDKNRNNFKIQGLRNFIRELARCIKENENRVIINATAGYKAMIAYAVLLGQVLNIPVYYRYETFDEIVELLPLPVQLSPDVYTRHARVFAFLEYGEVVEEDVFLRKFNWRAWGEVPEELKIFVDRVEIDSKNYVSLNPLGLIYLEGVEWDCSTIEDPTYKTNKKAEDKIRGTGGHALKFLQHNEKKLEAIAKLPWVTEVIFKGSSEMESGDSYKIRVEKDHISLNLYTKAGMGFLEIKTTFSSPKFLECVKRAIEDVLEKRG